MTGLRVFNAGNEGPFTLDGTRTFVLGRERVAVVDPGPRAEAHLRALVRAVGGARRVVVVQTHDHADHAAAAPLLADRLGAPVRGAGAGADRLEDGDMVETDAGRLVAVETPGHAREHLSFHWPDADAAFVGDLLLGRGDTTWVGEYAGCVADYLRSLDRIAALTPATLYPAHGPPIRDPGDVLERFRNHRRRRLDQVREARERLPDASSAELAEAIYGVELPAGVQEAARRSVEAMLHHLEGTRPKRSSPESG